MRISDWSSDVCSSDLSQWITFLYSTYLQSLMLAMSMYIEAFSITNSYGFLASWYVFSTTLSDIDRKSVVLGKSVSARVDLGGRRIIKKITTTHITYRQNRIIRQHDFKNNDTNN